MGRRAPLHPIAQIARDARDAAAVFIALGLGKAVAKSGDLGFHQLQAACGYVVRIGAYRTIGKVVDALIILIFDKGATHV